jgi:hypothetical protein
VFDQTHPRGLYLGKIQPVRGTRSTAFGITLLTFAWGAWIVIALSPATTPHQHHRQQQQQQEQGAISSTSTGARQSQIAEQTRQGLGAAGAPEFLPAFEAAEDLLRDKEIEGAEEAVRELSFPLPGLDLPARLPLPLPLQHLSTSEDLRSRASQERSERLRRRHKNGEIGVFVVGRGHDRV